MKKEHIKLSAQDLAHLEGLLQRGTMKVRKQKRALGLLELHRGKTLAEVSQTLGVRWQTVSAWRDAYAKVGLLFLDDLPRSGRPVEISGEQRAKVTALACSQAPDGRSRWSLRLLADKAVELELCEHLSYGQVRNILKKTS